MKSIVAGFRRVSGRILSYLLAAIFTFAAAHSARAALPDASEAVNGILDLQNGEYTVSGDNAIAPYDGLEIRNGKLTFSGKVNESLSSSFGGFTVGEGATVIGGSNADWLFTAENMNIAVTNGGMFKTAKSFGLARKGGTCNLLIQDAGLEVLNGGEFAFPVVDTASVAGKDYSCTVTITNSTVNLSGNVRMAYTVSGLGKKPNSIASAAYVYDSTIKVNEWGLASNNNRNIADDSKISIHAYFGRGTVLDVQNFKMFRYGRKSGATVTFDGATVKKHGTTSPFFNAYDENDYFKVEGDGLTLEIESDYSETSGNARFFGKGGITKTGNGVFALNNGIAQTFTGPLVISNGTWSSSLSYAATSFAVDGENSTLALSGALTAAAPDMSATQGGTLNLQSSTKRTLTLGTLTLGEDAKLSLTGGGLGVDDISANALVLSATTANKVALNFSDAANIPGGTYPIITNTGGTFASGDEAKFALDANAPEGSTLSVSGASLVLNVPLSNPATWTGGANDGKFSSAGNWFGKAVPGASDDVIISVASETTLDCDVALNVNSISFPSTSAKVTIEGSGSITCATAIVSGSAARPVIDVPVEFVAEGAYATIDVTGEVEFSGGVKGTQPANHSKFYGTYTLTATSWTLSSAITLAANATVTATGMTLTLSGTNVLNAEADSSMTVKYIKPTKEDVIGSFAGTLTATNQLFPEGANPSLSFDSGFTGILKVNEIKYHTAGYKRTFSLALAPSAAVVLGGTGINVMQGTINIAGLSLKSSADWSFTSTKNGYNMVSTIDIGSAGISVDTSDYYDPSAAGHTVYVKTGNSNYSDDVLSGAGGVTVNGNGQIVFQKSAPFTGTLAVNDNVTLTVNKDIYPGKGNVTIANSATFNLVQASSGTVPVSKTLTMSAGTTLRIPTLAGGILPLSVNALAFEGVTSESKVALNIEGGTLAAGYNPIIKSTTALPENAWDNFAVTLGENVVPAGMEPLYIAQDNTLYIVIKGRNDAIWTGGGETANFSVGANWMGGQIPSNGSCVHIAVGSAATLVCDIPGFSPASITFPGDSAAVTINGTEAITGVVAITNLSTTASHTINVPVYFAGDIQVKQAAMAEKDDLTKAHVTFAGGAHAAQGCAIESDGSAAVYSRCMFGDYYLYPTAENPWTASYRGNSKRNCLADNSTLHVPYAGSLHELYVGNGSVATVGNVSLQDGNRLSLENRGEYVVTNEMVVSGSLKNDGYAAHYGGDNGATDVFKIEKATCTKTDGYTFYFSEESLASHGTYYFGAGGINFGSGNGYFGIGRNKDGDAQTIRPWYGDFTIGTTSGNNKDKNPSYDIYMNRDVTFNTDDANGVGRTITVDARFRFQNTPTFTVSGSGKVLVNSVATNAVQPTVTVTDKATLAFKPGASLTTSNVTVNAGATLEVAQTGKVTLGADLMLEDDAILGFNFTKRLGTPVLGLADKAVTFGTENKIKVSLSGNRPTYGANGRHVLTSGGKFKWTTEDGVSHKATIDEPKDNKWPKWVAGVGVNDDGDIYVDIVPEGLVIRLR